MNINEIKNFISTYTVGDVKEVGYISNLNSKLNATAKKAGDVVEKITTLKARFGIPYMELEGVKERLAEKVEKGEEKRTYTAWNKPVEGYENFLKQSLKNENEYYLVIEPLLNGADWGTEWCVNGKTVSKEEVAKYVQPSYFNRPESTEPLVTMTVKLDNVVSIN